MEKTRISIMKEVPIDAMADDGNKVNEAQGTFVSIKPLRSQERLIIDFRFPCPCCGEHIVGQLVHNSLGE